MSICYKKQGGDHGRRETGENSTGAAEEGVDAAALVSSSEAIGHFHAKADLRIRGDYAGANRKLYWAFLRANAAKGAKTEWEELTSMKNRLSTGTKLTRGAHAANAEIELGKKVALKTVQKAGGEFYKEHPDNPHRSSCPDHQKLHAGGRCHHGEEGC